MRDNQLFILIKTALDQAFVALNLGQQILVKKNFQSVQQGTDKAATIYLSKIGDHRYGTPSKTDNYDEDTEIMSHTEAQWYQTTFQFNALCKQNPATTTDENNLTAADLVNYAAYIMQSDSTLQLLRLSNVGIQRITDIVNTPFSDENNQFEYYPSFDVILTHQQIITTSIPIVTSAELDINRV